jgi:hypothetical protein
MPDSEIDTKGFDLSWRLKGDPTSALEVYVSTELVPERNGYEGGVKGLHFIVRKSTGRTASYC